jgi:hypothetical protein
MPQVPRRARPPVAYLLPDPPGGAHERPDVSGASRRAADRVLAALLAGGHIAASAAPGLPPLAVFAPRRGVTMRVASVGADVLAGLERDGLVAWSGEGDSRRAVATAAGSGARAPAGGGPGPAMTAFSPSMRPCAVSGATAASRRCM